MSKHEPTLEQIAASDRPGVVLGREHAVLARELLALRASLEPPIAGNRIDALEGAVKLLEGDRFELKERLARLEAPRPQGDAVGALRDLSAAQEHRRAETQRSDAVERERDELRIAIDRWAERYVSARAERDEARKALLRIRDLGAATNASWVRQALALATAALDTGAS